MSDEKTTEITSSQSKPVWQAPTLVEFQDELAPKAGMGTGSAEIGIYRPTS